MTLRSLLIGRKYTSLRIVWIALIATVVVSVPIVLRADTVFPGLRWYLWGGLLAFTLGSAGYAGRNDCGLLGGWLAVFLAVLWIYVVTPLTAYLQGDGIGEREYAVPRPSVVRVDPYTELLFGLRYGPILAVLAALTFGSMAFVLGKHTRRVSPTD